MLREGKCGLKVWKVGLGCVFDRGTDCDQVVDVLSSMVLDWCRVDRMEALGKYRPAVEEGPFEPVRLFRSIAIWSASGRFLVSSFRS
jgi:hypothetical protein